MTGLVGPNESQISPAVDVIDGVINQVVSAFCPIRRPCPSHRRDAAALAESRTIPRSLGMNHVTVDLTLDVNKATREAGLNKISTMEAIQLVKRGPGFARIGNGKWISNTRLLPTTRAKIYLLGSEIDWLKWEVMRWKNELRPSPFSAGSTSLGAKLRTVNPRWKLNCFEPRHCEDINVYIYIVIDTSGKFLFSVTFTENRLVWRCCN